MTMTGFDGKVRRKPPRDTAWLVTSFAVNCVYWLSVYVFLVKPRVLNDWEETWGWWFTLFGASYAIPIILSFLFGVPDRSRGIIRFIWYRGGAMNLMAFLVFLAVMAIAGGHG